jgi:hypothetical protein
VVEVPATFAYLPAAARALVPELVTLDWPVEQHADCARCPMIDGRFGPWGFTAQTRCCTAHPSLANFLAGRALRGGEPGQGRVRARLEEPAGVSAWGIDPPPASAPAFADRVAHSFGRDVALRCPYWVGGEHSCGVWADRSATCRTWYCKHDDGLAGAVAWSRMHVVLSELESALARWAIDRGDPPEAPAPPAAWAAWFERAAALVDGVTTAELAPQLGERLGGPRAELADFVAVRRLRRRPIPAVLVPAVSELVRIGDDVLLTGYSSFDAVRAPAAIFELLARLDGVRPWRAALAEVVATRAGRGEPSAGLDEALVAELHRVMALRDPAGADDLPYTVDTGDIDRWSRSAGRPR